MIIKIENLKRLIKEELEGLVGDEGQSIINEMKNIINRLVKYHKRRMEWHWENFGPLSKHNDDPMFIINEWKRNFNDPNDRYMYWFGISDQFGFKDKLLKDTNFEKKLIDEIFKMPEWQNFHNNAINIIMVLEMLMNDDLKFGKKINSLIKLGAEENNFALIRQAIHLADSIGMI